MSRLLGLLTLLMLMGSISSVAADEPPIPAVLQPWIPWVLHDELDIRCPFSYQQADQRRCTWPGVLHLDLSARSGSFHQSWTLYRESWITLPGDHEQWPQDVRVDGQPSAVVERNQKPAVELAAGIHRIEGKFAWNELPPGLGVPADTGLIHLSLAGKPVPMPEFKDGTLKLRADRHDAAADNRLTVSVYRRVEDDYPLRLDTSIMLDVSGRPREAILAGARLDHFTLADVGGDLPARLAPDGELHVQLRPGRWRIQLSHIHSGPTATLRVPLPVGEWPKTEIWSFQAHPELREVTVTGVDTIDPAQTQMPAEWRNLPAYRMNAERTFTLQTGQRGDTHPARHELMLDRTLWLDFDGRGYSVSDRLQGTVGFPDRLDLLSAFQPGRISIDGQAQLVTRLKGATAGVEIRPGPMTLEADSRYSGPRNRIPVHGWTSSVRSAAVHLRLPPGWRLLHTQGSDNVPQSWLSAWTLLDVFTVLLLSLAAAKIWNWRWGLLMLLMLTLTWNEPGAPRYLWAALVATTAIVQAFPSGWMQRSAVIARGLVWAILLLVAVPFILQQLRSGLFPQLESTVNVQPPAPIQPLTAKLMSHRAESAGAAVPMAVEQAADVVASAPPAEPNREQPAEDEPLWESAIQTGPGLPDWEWGRADFSWNQAVAQEQQLRLWLLPPWATWVCRWLAGVLLLAVLAHSLRHSGTLRRALPGMLPLLLCGLLTGTPTERAWADIPDTALLDELKARLLQAPTCLPGCADLAEMRIEIQSDDLLHITQSVHAAESVSFPLPVVSDEWMPARVSVDGVDTPAARDEQGRLWLPLTPGPHLVREEGSLSQQMRYTLVMPILPHAFHAKAEGWTLDGIDSDGRLLGPQIQLSRRETASAATSTAQATSDNPVVRVQRTVHLGIRSSVDTDLIRLAPQQQPLVLRVPTLADERILTQGLPVTDGQVLINMGPLVERVSWHSALPAVPRLDLRASDNAAYSEEWVFDVQPQRHVEFSGLAPMRQVVSSAADKPRWRPWPGETLTVKVTTPPSVKGQTLSIDHASLEAQPGDRLTSFTLELRLRTSQAMTHVIALDPSASLRSLTLDSEPRSLRLDQGILSLPLTPGRHDVRIQADLPRGISTITRMPGVDLRTPSVNIEEQLVLPQNRWLLFASGPVQGPAVLFWGGLIVVVLLAIGLARSRITPYGSPTWLLLLLGLSQSPWWLTAAVIGWLIALEVRRRKAAHLGRAGFNTLQVALALYTAVAMLCLFAAVKQGLLGGPDMQVAGNYSDAYHLRWYQDRAGAALPTASATTAPLLAYRLIMLAWSLWLAFMLLRFLRNAYACYSEAGLWRSRIAKNIGPAA